MRGIQIQNNYSQPGHNLPELCKNHAVLTRNQSAINKLHSDPRS